MSYLRRSHDNHICIHLNKHGVSLKGECCIYSQAKYFGFYSIFLVVTGCPIFAYLISLLHNTVNILVFVFT